jgi:dolichol-phosphate mannosyltransferase
VRPLPAAEVTPPDAGPFRFTRPRADPVTGAAGLRAGEARQALSAGVTVLVPTRNERGNVAPLLRRLGEAHAATPFGVLFVDDSTDSTAEVIHRLSAHAAFPVAVLHRSESDRVGGLAGAVRAGLIATRSELVCVMDGDLQHPPEVVPALIDEAKRSNADVVIASRHGAGGDLATFAAHRRALSRGSEVIARALFPRRLRGVSDPLSGFFVVRRRSIGVAALRPCGFKILLEILLSGPHLSTSEVGFRFGERHAGESKANPAEAARYLRHLLALRVRRWNLTGRHPPTVVTSMPVQPSDVNASC